MDDKQRRNVVIWLFAVCMMIFGMVMIGGITRLTHSGLSMVDWKPLMGMLPPMSEQEWLETFNKYKQFPEYQKVNLGMTLADFKGIFFWEYFHRLWGRLIGMVFFFPFLYFWRKKYFDSRMFRKLMIGFVLGGLQGLMGWFMVKSGLVDRPSVSHYRLAAHLVLAFGIFGYLFWLILDFKRVKLKEVTERLSEGARSLASKTKIITGLISVQIVYGAFVAGKKAGFGYNTFPKMNDSWIPSEAFSMTPFLANFVENNAMLQFVHRTIAWIVFTGIIAFFVRYRSEFENSEIRKAAHLLVAAVGIQFFLGVMTILFIIQSPVVIPVIHQAGAFFLLAAAINMNHHSLKP